MSALTRLLSFSLVASSVIIAQDGTSPLIEQRLTNLRESAVILPLAEISSDESPVPEDWLALVSWNIQVGGVSTSPTATRPPLVANALQRLFLGTYQFLAAQEISGSGNSTVLLDLLPGEATTWNASFVDTTDAQDNGFWYRPIFGTEDERTLFTTGVTDGNGRLVSDSSLAVHPPRAAHFRINDFDFTLITLHLTFANGDTTESAREMGVLLDYLDSYFEQPGHDPDVIISGDFNIPSRLSGQTGSAGIVLDSLFDSDPRFQVSERRFVVTVHDPTSRRSRANGGTPANNYDHFIFSADALEELVQARRVSTEILTDNIDDPEQRLTSDHFPIVAFFRTIGDGVRPDVTQSIFSIRSVVNGASFAPGISSGSWLTIFGDNLAATSRIWRNDEIVDGALPTELDGVRVLVNGKQAAVFFVSPGQLNVQAPDDTALGTVTVEVIRDGVGSASGEAELREAVPAFFLFNQENRKFPAAVHADGTFVGKSDLFGGALPARPAKPGDVVLLFGTGFGPTDPPVAAGSVFTGASPLRTPARILFNGVEGTVLFGGLSGAGLNQFNVVVPEGLTNGDVELLAEVMGQRTQSGVFMTIEGASEPPPPPPLPTAALSADRTSIQGGETTTLRWMSTNSTSVEILPGVGPVAANGSIDVSPSATTDYLLTVVGEGGEATASVRIIVTQPPPPTVTLNANRTAIQSGESTTLSWTSTNATSAEITPGIGLVDANGSIIVSPSQTITYVITVTGIGGQASANLRVTVSPPPPPSQGIVVVSQIYGGGGNQDATLKNDFIELFNRGNTAANIAGWTVQYASATGSNWQATDLSGTILPGQYYLVQEGMGQTGDGAALPTPDATGGIGLSASSGKVALVSGTALLSGATPSASSIVDLVGYGSAGFSEGSPAPGVTNSTGIRRAASGCSDTDDNGSDFTSATPSPRNSATPRMPCN